MKVVSYIFSFLCNQDASRSFEIGGQLLPFCQRCTGVYVGMGISFVYLLLSDHYKKGLPRSSILYANIASLLIMPVFGFHLLDPGPAWRFWTGLVFGNAIAFLILPAASIIRKEGKASGYHTRVSTILFWVLFGFLNAMPFWFPIQSSYFYYVVVMVALIGLLCLLFCMVTITVFLTRKIVVYLILKGFSNECAKN
jgi:uncharacterized membrane protein